MRFLNGERKENAPNDALHCYLYRIYAILDRIGIWMRLTLI